MPDVVKRPFCYPKQNISKCLEMNAPVNFFYSNFTNSLSTKILKKSSLEFLSYLFFKLNIFTNRTPAFFV